MRGPRLRFPCLPWLRLPLQERQALMPLPLEEIHTLLPLLL